MNLYKLIIKIIAIICLCTNMTTGQSQVISGKVTDEQTGESLIGAHIRIVPGSIGTQSDEYGRYHLALTGFSVQVICSYVGYDSDTVTISQARNQNVDFILAPVKLDEVIITESRIPPKENIGVLSVPVEQLRKNKFFLGEEDIVRSLALLPGVSLGNVARNGLYVRGSDPQHNQFLLDGTPVYNTGHLFGLFSIFNSATVKDVKLYKGHIPPRYGSRLASIVEVNTREGNRNKFTSQYKVGLLSSSGLWEGPINENASFMSALRTSYLGLTMVPVRILYNSELVDNYFNYWMYDLNVKGNWEPTKEDHFFLSVYHGNDAMPIYNQSNTSENKDFLRWGNTTTSLRYSRTWSSALYSKFQMYNTQYTNVVKFASFNKDDNGNNHLERALRDKSTVWESGVFNQNDWLISDQWKMQFGWQLQRYLLKPNQLTFQIADTDKTESISSDHTYRPYWQNTFFGDVTFTPLNWLDLNTGMRASGYLRENGQDQWYYEPRMSIGINFTPRHALKASWFETSQFLHQLTHYTFGAPSDFWVPTVGKVMPQTASQWSVGYSTSMFSGKYDFTVEAYTKTMNHLINFREGTNFLLLLDHTWDEVVESDGIGDAKGFEWFLHKKEGKWNGWLGYTLSWSRRKFENLNYGRWFYSTYDRRHEIELFVDYQINENWNVSGSWEYRTGHRISIPTGKADLLYYTEKNNWVYPAFHQLNIGATRTKYKGGHKKSELSFGLFNAYAHNNPWYVELEYDGIPSYGPDGDYQGNSATKLNLNGVSLFNMLPYVSYKLLLD